MARSPSKFRPAAYDHGAPISRIDLTPLAAIGCVLSALLVLALPAPTHALLFDLRNYGPRPDIPVVRDNRLQQHRDGSLYWNGAPISLVEVRQMLAAPNAQAYQPALLIEFSGETPYGAVFPVMAAISASKAEPVMLCFPIDVRPDAYALPWPDRDPGEAATECSGFIPA